MVAAIAAALTLGTAGNISARATGTTSAGIESCTPGYKPGIKNKASDVDCWGGGGNGPSYARPYVVYRVNDSKDRYRLDSDNHGHGCE